MSIAQQISADIREIKAQMAIDKKKAPKGSQVIRRTIAVVTGKSRVVKAA